MELILASQSPRRRQLLSTLGVDFSVKVADIDETPVAGETPEVCVDRLARGKADAVWHTLQDRLDKVVLAADTIVVVDQKILGKPRTREHAVHMLTQLSGRKHQVLTAVALQNETSQQCTIQTSEVSFATLAEDEILRYVATGEPDDKAGAYAIQGLAAAFVVSLAGSYSGVVGLPLYETRQLLRRFGIHTAI